MKNMIRIIGKLSDCIWTLWPPPVIEGSERYFEVIKDMREELQKLQRFALQLEELQRRNIKYPFKYHLSKIDTLIEMMEPPLKCDSMNIRDSLQELLQLLVDQVCFYDLPIELREKLMDNGFLSLTKAKKNPSIQSYY